MSWAYRVGTTGFQWLSRRMLGASLAALLVQPMAGALPMNAQRPAISQLLRANIISVVNGNTLIVELFDQPARRDRVVQVQLVGVEPPNEMRFGYFSGQYLQEIATAGVFIEIPDGLPSDGILPAYVWSGDVLINEEMLLLGHGFKQPNAVDSRYDSALTAATAVAQSQGRGIWNYYSPLLE